MTDTTFDSVRNAEASRLLQALAVGLEAVQIRWRNEDTLQEELHRQLDGARVRGRKINAAREAQLPTPTGGTRGRIDILLTIEGRESDRERDTLDAAKARLLAPRPAPEPFRIGVEVKVEGGSGAIARQLHRYASTGALDALLLVTSRRRHVISLPVEMDMVPVRGALIKRPK